LWFFETGSCHLAQAGLELSILLPQPLKCWNYRCEHQTQQESLFYSFNVQF
jgi:hypothetical protein